jgi:hypothetical protein
MWLNLALLHLIPRAAAAVLDGTDCSALKAKHFYVGEVKSTDSTQVLRGGSTFTDVIFYCDENGASNKVQKCGPNGYVMGKVPRCKAPSRSDLPMYVKLQ